MILVTGATGKVGSEVVRLLAGQRQPVRALVRDPSRLHVEHVDVAVGDFGAPETLDAAMPGIDTLVLVSPAVPAQEMAAIDSAARHEVKHIVKISSKASADSPVDRRRGQAQIEAHLAASGVDYTLLRSNAFMQNLLAMAPSIKAMESFTMSAGDDQIGMIDARDVATTAVAVATAPSAHAGRAYWLTGPELITYSDVARELSTALGRSISYVRVTPDEHLAAMIAAGVPPAVATSNAQAFGLIAQGDAAWRTDEVESLTGTPARDLRTFVADHLQLFG
jgi:uncharacterized protein YbjT (DUF2867 family)